MLPNATGAEMPRRVIAHLDADAFYASVHLLEDPSLKGKPVIVAGSGPRSIVTTASYEARRFGIGSAQPAARARLLCPHAVFIAPDFSLYRAYSQRAMALMEKCCDSIEPLSLDEAYLDITQLEQPARAMRQLVARIEDQVGVRYSVGIGPNKLCAKVLSDHGKPRAFNIRSREGCRELFGDQSPRLIPGFGPKTVAALEAAGLRTIAQVGDASEADLVAAFGPRRGLELRQRARFEHDGVVQTAREPKSRSEERTFAHDIGDLEELERRMRDLAGELCEGLAARELRGRTIGIKVRLADFTTVTRARTIHDATCDGDRVAGIACELLREYAPPQAVRLLGVRVAGFDAALDDEGSPATSVQLQLPHPQGTQQRWW